MNVCLTRGLKPIALTKRPIMPYGFTLAPCVRQKYSNCSVSSLRVTAILS